MGPKAKMTSQKHTEALLLLHALEPLRTSSLTAVVIAFSVWRQKAREFNETAHYTAAHNRFCISGHACSDRHLNNAA
jgi:hypothetical protein